MGRRMGAHSRATERLPSLPQILIHILDASQHDGTAVPRLAEIVRRDPATTTRLLNAANSAAYRSTAANGCTTVERALMVLGTETVRTIVITAAIQQFIGGLVRPEQQFLKQFWRRSLLAATVAQVLASLTRYRNPSEAYLCGLLHNMGQLLLLRRHRTEWLELWRTTADQSELAAEEQSQFQANHIELGAQLLGDWPDNEQIADAVRYQLEPAERMRDASHLAKIVNLAAALAASDSPDDTAVHRADVMFGIGEALLRELCQQIAGEVTRVAASLGIDISVEAEADSTADSEQAHARLGEQLSELTQLTQWGADLRRAHSLELLGTAVQRVVYMTLGIRRCVLFAITPDGNTLQATLTPGAETGAPDFAVPLERDRNPIAEALLSHSPHTVTETTGVLERQLLRACRAERLVCLPLVEAGRPLGVLVLGLQPDAIDPLQRSTTTAALCHEIAGALHQHIRQHDGTTATAPTALLQQISEAVHEAGNPLTIIRNYLELLRVRLGEDHAAHSELNLIREEIDRVGTILLRLRDPDSSVADQTADDLDQLLDDLARIFEQSLCATHGIELRRHGRAGSHWVERPAQLKQVLVNLMKNAVEAMPQGGVLELLVESPVVANGSLVTLVTVRDNGPGIPPHILPSLFQPVTTTKQGAHAGLGLSIVKRLVDELAGTIVCRSSAAGTSFELLLPRSAPREAAL